MQERHIFLLHFHVVFDVSEYTAHGYSKIQDNNHIYTADIRNIMGACHYLVWEV